jgi:DNA-binding NarL/FixJ family response regulator
VLLVDDHTLVRQALGTMLQHEPDIEVAGQAADGNQAVELTRQLQPDVVLMDVHMPGMNGVQATRTIHAEFPGVCVIGLSMADRDQQAEAMRDAGAMDYVTKTAAAEELLAVMRGCYARLRDDLPPAAGV